MRTALSDHKDPHKTVRQVMPYDFQLLPNGKMAIKKTNGQTLIVSRAEVANILRRDDLDVHRRKMYEAGLEEFKKSDSKKAVQ